MYCILRTSLEISLTIKINQSINYSHFFTRETRHIVPRCEKGKITILPGIPEILESSVLLKTLLLPQFLLDYSEYLARETRHI